MVIMASGSNVPVSEGFYQSFPNTRPASPLSFAGDHGYDADSIPTEGIAVVGMSGRFPESDSVDEFWRLLETGTTTHRVIPSSRLNVEDFYDASGRKHNALLARHGCFIRNPGEFDHRLFNISPREALQMDPVQRMLLMSTYEALEMAGYSSRNDEVAPRVATYFGQTTDDWKTINEQHGIDTHFLSGVNRSFAPGRLAHYFKWAGGFYSIDTGCSSSATAVCLARAGLISGECDAAVVGGGSLLTAPEWYAGLSQGGFLSPSGACKTFSDTADGYCRGEAVAVVVLKRMADAIRNKDNVLAVIGGASRNSNAGVGSITHPDEDAQKNLYRRVLWQAGVRPEDVGFIEMHGTGTQAGDKVETAAVHRVFASKSTCKRTKPLIVGAVKADIGHSEAAAGVVSLIKAILVLQHGIVPPQPDQPFTLNPHLVPIMRDDIRLADGQPFPRDHDSERNVMINNFDAAGGNVSILIHDAPTLAPSSALLQSDPRRCHIVATSGHTSTSLTNNRSRLAQYLTEHPDTDLASLGYTTTVRRIHQAHREAFVVNSISELSDQLQHKSQTPSATSRPRVKPSGVIFAFTGQGSQYIGMGSVLCRTSPSFAMIIDSFQRICDEHGQGCNITDIIRGSEDTSVPEPIHKEQDMQVAIVALEIALAQYWHSLGLLPALLVGHSLGEYAALCVAGVISVSDALLLTYERSKLIFARCPPHEAGMLAVGVPAAEVQRRLPSSAATPGLEVCCINGEASTVVGGPISAIDALYESLESEGGIKVSRLAVSHAFHTQQMDPVLEELEGIASRINFQIPRLPVASTLLGRVVQPGEDDVFNAQYMRRHTREPVAFKDAVHACEEHGLINDQSLVIEIGPHPTCIHLVSSSLQTAKPIFRPSLRRGRDDWESISECLATAYRMHLPVKWDEFHRDHLEHVRSISNLPTYAFDLQNFWRSYKSPSSIPNSSSGAENLKTTSLHAVEKVHHNGDRIHATFTADLKEKDLARAIREHVVDGVAICPASIFIDMGYSAAAYLQSKTQDSSSKALESFELVDLLMQSPLVLPNDTASSRRVSVEAVLDQAQGTVSIRFSTQIDDTAKLTQHGSCTVRLDSSSVAAKQAWARMKGLVDSRIQGLRACSSPKEVYAMDRRLFYKLFSEIVEYSDPYQAVREALVAPDFHDAYVTLNFDQVQELGTFTCNPFAVDAMVHVAGFLLNADVEKPKGQVHIAKHMGFLRILQEFAAKGQYYAYATVRERHTKAGTSLCDVYVFDEKQELIALCNEIRFQRLERDVFARLTGPARSSTEKPSVLKGPQLKASESSDASTPGQSTPRTSAPSDAVDLAEELLVAIAGRTGIDMNELKEAKHTTLTDMGVDSQMSIAILADFQKATGVELPAAFFTINETVQALQEALRDKEAKDHINASIATISSANTTDNRQKLDTTTSRPVLIQGDSHIVSAPLFMTTDGSGTAESYIHLPALSGGRRIYALESPFIENPEEFDLSIEEMAEVFIRTIRNIQRQGPYLIGGWSAGAAYAYEVARRLTLAGERILGLIILDMRVPSPTPTHLVTSDFIDKLGAFEGINRARNLANGLSDRERQHLIATCRALSRYDPLCFPADRRPEHATIVWARWGLDRREEAPLAAMARPDKKDMTQDEYEAYFKYWFHGRREKFGVNGWESLLGDEIEVHSVDGDHFSMMAPPFVKKVGDIMVEAVDRVTSM